MKKRFPFYKQHDLMDCGPTCLQMIAKHYGKNFSVRDLRQKTQIGKEGVNLLGIGEAAEAVGFRTQGVKITCETLRQHALLPCILHWNQEHFVILYKVAKQKFYIADPAVGLLTYSHQEMKLHWIIDNTSGQEEGIALLLEPAPAFYQQEEDVRDQGGGLAFRNIFNYLLPYKKFIVQLFFGLGLASIFQLVLPFLTQSIVDVGVNTANIHFIYIVLLGQIVLVIGRLSVDFIRSWILLHISSRVNISILTDFLIKIMKLPVSFFDSKKVGDILQRMNDHQRIESFLTGSSINVLFSLVNLLVFSIVLALFNTTIFIVFIVSAILYSAWVILFLKKRRVLDYRRFEIAAREQSTTIQLIQGMQEIRLNGVERPMRWGWERLQARLFRLNVRILALNQWQQSGSFFINEGKNIFITFLSAKAVIEGQMTLGTMLAVQYIIGQLNSPIDQMIGFIQGWQNAKISMERLNEIHDTEDEEPAGKFFLQELPREFTRKLVGGKTPVLADSSMAYPGDAGDRPADEPPEMDFQGNRDRSFIQFQKVSFTYSGAGNEAVLNNIDLTIKKGQTTAIVGVSGSGKTTLLKLLLRFYEPQQGEIRIAGTPLSNISHSLWRSHCGVVMQDSYIFPDTIARNIAVGTETPDHDKLSHAIHIANIGEFIESLPLRLNTKIGAEGMGISMGQRQRILIARAVYRDPEFILLDEATNSLDANNEMVIVQNLASFLKGKTVVIVAHRLSTVKNADQIIFLKRGVIAERGTHQELIDLKGEYFGLVKNQLDLGS